MAVTCQGTPIRFTVDFSPEIIEARKQWDNLQPAQRKELSTMNPVSYKDIFEK